MTSVLDCRQVASDAGLDVASQQQLAEIARTAANLGAAVLMQHYGRLSSIESKGRIGDLVTNADVAAEKVVLDYLIEHTPTIAILAEESGSSGTPGSLCWCVDPLDGTTNFAHGYPFFATSVGLIWKGLPLLGSVAVPFLNETYWCSPHQGSYLNDTPIQVSDCITLQDSLLVTGFAYDRHEVTDNNYAEFCWLTHRCRGVRRGGAAAVDLAFVASGRLDGYWERGLAPWDLAAGAALVACAGGVVGDYKDSLFDVGEGRILATSSGLHLPLKQELARVSAFSPKLYGA
jgi:myo-inositol-1(or 4)-monophosphatase